MTALETALGGHAIVDARVSFEVPGSAVAVGAELSFVDGDLDFWAEHLVWCYSLLGVAEGATIAVQDFGTSPTAYLGSRLLMPTLEQGVAERMGARIICLDASPERIVLTPEVVRQVRPDVLVVRADVLGLLLEGSRRSGVDLTTLGMTIVAAGGLETPPLPTGDWRRLLHEEASLLLAPECTLCGRYHLREGVYRVERGEGGESGEIVNLRQPSASRCDVSRFEFTEETCALGERDMLFRRVDAGSGAR